jgi:hypothetical protein
MFLPKSSLVPWFSYMCLLLNKEHTRVICWYGVFPRLALNIDTIPSFHLLNCRNYRQEPLCLALDLTILLIFSKNQLFVSFVLYIFLLVSISLITAVIFITSFYKFFVWLVLVSLRLSGALYITYLKPI